MFVPFQHEFFHSKLFFEAAKLHTNQVVEGKLQCKLPSANASCVEGRPSKAYPLVN